jgi:hypothetical protein
VASGFDLSSIGSGAANIGVTIFLMLLTIGVVVGVVMLIQYRKKYKQFKITIWGRDSFGGIYEEYDEAGIFVDRHTGNKRLFLRRNKVGLNPDNIPYVINKKGKKMIYLTRVGLKNFNYLKPRMNLEGVVSFSVGEEDVNWAVNAYERQKKLFGGNILLQYLPFIALALVSIVILIVFIYLFKNIGVLKDVAVAFQEAATAFAQSQGGTVVIGG